MSRTACVLCGGPLNSQRGCSACERDIAPRIAPIVVLHPRDGSPTNIQSLRGAGYVVVLGTAADVRVVGPSEGTFTREDVTRLRSDARVLRDALMRQGPTPTWDFPKEEMDGKMAHAAWLASLADRIASLLPPEGP